MESKFNKNWKRSKQPRRQRKYRVNAPNHIRRRFLGAHLDKKLREKYGKSVGLRKGDEVKVMRGEFKGKRGKVGVVDLKRSRIQIEGLQRMKTGGEKLVTWFAPSNLLVMELDDSDSQRMKKKVLQPKTVVGSSMKLKDSSKPEVSGSSAVPKTDKKVKTKPEGKKG